MGKDSGNNGLEGKIKEIGRFLIDDGGVRAQALFDSQKHICQSPHTDRKIHEVYAKGNIIGYTTSLMVPDIETLVRIREEMPNWVLFPVRGHDGNLTNHVVAYFNQDNSPIDRNLLQVFITTRTEAFETISENCSPQYINEILAPITFITNPRFEENFWRIELDDVAKTLYRSEKRKEELRREFGMSYHPLMHIITENEAYQEFLTNENYLLECFEDIRPEDVIRICNEQILSLRGLDDIQPEYPEIARAEERKLANDPFFAVPGQTQRTSSPQILTPVPKNVFQMTPPIEPDQIGANLFDTVLNYEATEEKGNASFPVLVDSDSPPPGIRPRAGPKRPRKSLYGRLVAGTAAVLTAGAVIYSGILGKELLDFNDYFASALTPNSAMPKKKVEPAKKGIEKLVVTLSQAVKVKHITFINGKYSPQKVKDGHDVRITNVNAQEFDNYYEVTVEVKGDGKTYDLNSVRLFNDQKRIGVVEQIKDGIAIFRIAKEFGDSFDIMVGDYHEGSFVSLASLANRGIESILNIAYQLEKEVEQESINTAKAKSIFSSTGIFAKKAKSYVPNIKDLVDKWQDYANNVKVSKVGYAINKMRAPGTSHTAKAAYAIAAGLDTNVWKLANRADALKRLSGKMTDTEFNGFCRYITEEICPDMEKRIDSGINEALEYLQSHNVIKETARIKELVKELNVGAYICKLKRLGKIKDIGMKKLERLYDAMNELANAGLFMPEHKLSYVLAR